MPDDLVELRLHRESIDGLIAFVIQDGDAQVQARIALTGATLLSWRAPAGPTSIDLIDGYRTREELDAQAGVRSGIMAPFTNRIRDGRYEFGGADHDLSEAATGSPPLLLHGLYRQRRFAPVESIATDDSFMLRLRNQDALDPASEGFAGYPYQISVDVVYVVRRSSITVEILVTNFGEGPAPVSMGWHPYFTLDAPADSLVLEVDAASRVRTDDDLIPVEGSTAIVALVEGDPLDFREPRSIGDAVLDVCLTDLATHDDGLHHTLLRNPRSGLELDVWQERGSMHVYTGDHLERGARQSIALEPVEALTNAFNRPDQADVIALDPGMVRAFRFGASLRTSS